MSALEQNLRVRNIGRSPYSSRWFLSKNFEEARDSVLWLSPGRGSSQGKVPAQSVSRGQSAWERAVEYAAAVPVGMRRTWALQLATHWRSLAFLLNEAGNHWRVLSKWVPWPTWLWFCKSPAGCWVENSLPGSKGGNGETSEETAAVTRRKSEWYLRPGEMMCGQLMDLLLDWM